MFPRRPQRGAGRGIYPANQPSRNVAERIGLQPEMHGEDRLIYAASLV